MIQIGWDQWVRVQVDTPEADSTPRITRLEMDHGGLA
jgi:hypothetical protein